MNWALRLTSHLGYREPGGRAQFLETAGTADPVRLIEHAASIGMAGVLDPWALCRPASELGELAAALRINGLEFSSISLPIAMVQSGCWCDRTQTGRKRLELAVRSAGETAKALGGSILAIFLGGNGLADEDSQLAAAAETLGEMATVANGEGLVIAVEPMTVFANSLLRRSEDALGFVRSIGMANVKMVFDTAHSARMDEDIVQSFVSCFDEVALLQLADLPGRVEPGAGTLDIAGVAAASMRLGYSGLVDLEHDWAAMTREGEAQGLARLHVLDAKIRAGTPGQG